MSAPASSQWGPTFWKHRRNSLEGAAIECLVCGSLSYNPSDVKNLYCGRCHMFHTEWRVCLRCGNPVQLEVLAEHDCPLKAKEA